MQAGDKQQCGHFQAAAGLIVVAGSRACSRGIRCWRQRKQDALIDGSFHHRNCVSRGMPCSRYTSRSSPEQNWHKSIERTLHATLHSHSTGRDQPRVWWLLMRELAVSSCSK